MIVGIDEAGHDDHPAAVEHLHSGGCRELDPTAAI
jgi:hypothetical protein